MKPEAYAKGLYQVGGSTYAYVQPDGIWGMSNAGLISDGDQSLLVDTLYDLKLTAEMLGTMRDAVPASRRIDILVNSHADGDHTFGNQLVKGARIITSRETAAEFFKITPELMHKMVVGAVDRRSQAPGNNREERSGTGILRFALE